MTLPSESYDAFVDADLVEGQPVNGEASGFVIDDASKADWALRKLGEVVHARTRDAAFVEAERDRLARWLERREQQRQRFAEYLTMLLRVYYLNTRPSGPSKSVVLPHGRLSMRVQEAKYLRDDDALLTSLDGRYTKIKAEVEWSALKQAVAPLTDQPFSECLLVETGEVLPGLRLQTPPMDVFKASPTLD